jgi:hypothetical protein
MTGSILALPAFGQHPGRSGLGLKAGAQMTTVHVEGVVHEPVLGAVAGLYVPLWCGPRFEIQPELLASAQGHSFMTNDGKRHVLRMYYLQLPLSAKLYFSNALNVQGGVQISRLLSAGYTSEGEVDDATDQYRTFEFGTSFGLGVDLTSGVDLGFRYYSGLSSITDDLELNPTNRAWQLSIGYRLKRFARARARRRA